MATPTAVPITREIKTNERGVLDFGLQLGVDTVSLQTIHL